MPHPRSYGTFPRKIGLYALEDQIVPLAQAIRSASGLPADILRLPERGYLKPGYYADMVVFDPNKFRETATYDKPHQYATGVRYLFVNGVLTIEQGKHTEALAGKALGMSEGETGLSLPHGPADLAALLSRRHDTRALAALGDPHNM